MYEKLLKKNEWLASKKHVTETCMTQGKECHRKGHFTETVMSLQQVDIKFSAHGAFLV